MASRSEAEVRYVTAALPPRLDFSVITLVADQAKYDRMLASFRRGGFDGSSAEFIAVDNRSGNSLDGYAAPRAIVPETEGRYILFTHDDIELMDEGAEALRETLDALTAADPNWMVAGNAGSVLGTMPDRTVRHLADPWGESRMTGGPRRVWSLDENFLVLRRDRLVYPSVDLEGFHLFATDLCFQAELAGGTAYVVPFMLRHHSKGAKSTAFEAKADALRAKYDAIFPGRVMASPSDWLVFGRTARLRHRISQRLQRAPSLLRRGLKRVLRHQNT